MDTKEQVRLMVEDGLAARRIANKLSVSVEEVRNIIESNGYILLKEQFDDSKIVKICELYNNGVSAKQLGKKFSIDKRRVQKWANEQGTLRSKGESLRVTFFNEGIFDEIDTPEKAYWLGFCYADGMNSPRVCTFSVSLKREDREHLLKLAYFVGLPSDSVCDYMAKIKDEETGVIREYPASKLRMYSKHICEVMSKHGCVQNKTFLIMFPDWLREDLESHFIRGMFDGDGCLTFRETQREWKWSLVSTAACCESIKRRLKDIDIEVNYRYISKTGKNTYELETSGNEKITKIMQWLHEGSGKFFRLDRKYDKYLQLVDQQNSRTGRWAEASPIVIEKDINAVSISGEDRYASVVSVGDKLLTASYLRGLSTEAREALVKPLFDYFKLSGWIYPEFFEQHIKSEYKKLEKYIPDLSLTEVNGNSPMATDICKNFCQSFYSEFPKIWNNDNILLKLIRNRLVLNWESDERFSISRRMMVQGIRSMRLVPPLTMFKPSVAKYICMKYSEPGDLVGDYSAGFGGRLLGAMSCGRKYIGTDPMTAKELQKMIVFFGFKDCTVFDSGSENFVGEAESVDLYWSSPPYYNYEKYSNSDTQAYNRGEDYFFNIYWRKTLYNVWAMLKPGKWFGLNIMGQPKMLDMAIEKFGKPVEEVSLKIPRSHMNKSAGHTKLELIYMFKK